MKDEKEETGEELIDLNEAGNKTEKKEKEKNKKPNSLYKIIISIILCLILLISCYCYFNYRKNNKTVFDKTTLKNLKLKNRIFMGPVSHELKK